MYNYKLIIQYDGTRYAGWQIQNNVKTIQQELVNSIETILQEKINLTGSGRTDAGVHALGQTANFLCSKELDTWKFRHSLNSLLPDDISVISMETADENFHARFDAKKRSYIYLISHDKSPFYFNYSYNFALMKKYDISRLNKLSKILIGEHDFTSFCRTKTEIENKNCEIFDLHWRQNDSFTIFYVEANRFLHGMVRTLVGTLLQSNKNNFDENSLIDILEKKDRTEAGEAVPAKGLFLNKVRY